MDGRKHVIVYQNGRKRTISYPRYLMMVHLDRELTSDEEVDHIDSDFTNNSLDNLRILSKIEHHKVDVKRLLPETVNCKWCNVSFEIYSKYHSNHGTDSKKAGPFCSKKCVGEYGASIQNNRAIKLEPDKNRQRMYYKDKF